VFVTHDQDEALEVADRIVVFNHGKVEQSNVPDEVYDNPASPFVYQFLGNANRFETRIRGNISEVGGVPFDTPEHAHLDDAAGTAYVRPHDLDMVCAGTPASVAARVDHIIKLGPTVRLELARSDNGDYLEIEVARERYAELGVGVGQTVFLAPRRGKVFLDLPRAAA